MSKVYVLGRDLLTHNHLPFGLALLAMLLTLPSLGAGLLLDDYAHKLQIQHTRTPFPLINAPWDLFRWFDGDPQRNRAMMDYGILPWWADLGLKGAFWRPIASLTHWLDYSLWPEIPALMHAQSIAWYALLVAVTTVFYRRMMGAGTAAGLAALLYAIDSTHATPITFLANRNALIAAVFGVLCLTAHERWRRAGWRPGAVLGPLLLALALLAKEEAVAVCAYLGAFAVFLENAPWRRRIASLAPYAAVVLVWRLAWLHLEYGVSNFSLYIDPLQEPVRFGFALLRRAPILLVSELSTVPADLAMLLSRSMNTWLSLGAWLALAVMALLALPAIRTQRTTRFWVAGTLLSVFPASATFLSDRMLLFAGLGAMALAGQLLSAAFTGGLPGGLSRRSAGLALACLLLLVHGIVAPVGLALRTAAPTAGRSYIESLYLHEPLDPTVQRQDVVLVNPPSAFATIASSFLWASEHAPLPRHMRALCSSYCWPAELWRSDETTIVLRPDVGFLAAEPDRLFGPEGRVFQIGQRIRLAGLTVEITALALDGRPIEAAFHFDVPLEDESLRWLEWTHGEFRRFTPPPVGGSVVLPGSWR